MAGIPTVKRWRVTFDAGDTPEVYAPTKRLALLNVRLDEVAPDWRGIKSIGLLRRSERSN